MNEIKNWRNWVIWVLLGMGFLMLMAISAEDSRPLGKWLEVRLYLALGSAACFYAMYRLQLYWETKGKITKLLNHNYDGDKD